MSTIKSLWRTYLPLPLPKWFHFSDNWFSFGQLFVTLMYFLTSLLYPLVFSENKSKMPLLYPLYLPLCQSLCKTAWILVSSQHALFMWRMWQQGWLEPSHKANKHLNFRCVCTGDVLVFHDWNHLVWIIYTANFSIYTSSMSFKTSHCSTCIKVSK